MVDYYKQALDSDKCHPKVQAIYDEKIYLFFQTLRMYRTCIKDRNKN